MAWDDLNVDIHYMVTFLCELGKVYSIYDHDNIWTDSKCS